MKCLQVVAAVIVYNGMYLSVQRGKTRYGYTSFKYEFPGGKVEHGETPRQALHREIMEELSYDIEVGPRLAIVRHTYPDFEIELDTYLCTAASQQFHLNEHIAFQWLSADQLPQLDWAQADKAIVETICCKAQQAAGLQ